MLGLIHHTSAEGMKETESVIAVLDGRRGRRSRNVFAQRVEASPVLSAHDHNGQEGDQEADGRLGGALGGQSREGKDMLGEG